MHAPTDVDREARLVAALERHFGQPTPDGTFLDALERQLIARRRARLGVRTSGVREWWARLTHADTLPPPRRATGPTRPIPRPSVRLGLAAAAVLIAVVALSFGAGSGRLPAAGELARTIAERVRMALPLPSKGSVDGTGLLPPLPTGDLYVVPGVGILPVGEDDLVQAQSPLSFRTDVVSGTVSHLWLNKDGTHLHVDVDVTGAVAAIRSEMPAGSSPDLYVTYLLRPPAGTEPATTTPREIVVMRWDRIESHPWRSWNAGVQEFPNVPGMDAQAVAFTGPVDRLPSDLRSVDLLVIVSADPVAVDAVSEVQPHAAPPHTLVEVVTIPLASAQHDDLVPAIPCDVRATVGGVTVRATAVGYTHEATYVRLDAASDTPGETIAVTGRSSARSPSGDDVPPLLELRDAKGRAYRRIDEVGEARTGVAAELQDPVTVRFEPVPADVGALSLALGPIVVDLLDASTPLWITSPGDSDTIRIPVPDADSIPEDAAFRLHEQRTLVSHPSAVLVNRTVSVGGHALRVVSVVPVARPGDATRVEYFVYVIPGPQQGGREMIGVRAGAVARVGWRDWRRVGGWRDLGRRYCDEGTGFRWDAADVGTKVLGWNTYIESAKGRSVRDGGTVDLCFTSPTFLVAGPWILALPVPNAGSR